MTEKYEDTKTADTMQEEFERWQKQKKEAKKAVKMDLLNGDGMMPDDDKVNHPSHYMSFYADGIECIDAMKAAFGEVAVAHFCVCNSFKYLWRHSSKGQMEDIDKALWYLNKYKELGRIDMGG